MKGFIRAANAQKNRRNDLLSEAFPELEAAKVVVIADIEEAARSFAILRLMVNERKIADSFDQTFHGNVYWQIRSALTLQVTIIISRLFHFPRRNNGLLIEKESDLSLMLVADYFKREEVRKLKMREQFRWGATSRRVGPKIMSLDSLRVRIANGKLQGRDNAEQIDGVLRDLEAFVTSKEYGQIKVYRTERIAHRLNLSLDRKRWQIDGNAGGFTFEEFFRVTDEALVLAEKAVAIFFGHHISRVDLEEIWKDYSLDFFSRFGSTNIEA